MSSEIQLALSPHIITLTHALALTHAHRTPLKKYTKTQHSHPSQFRREAAEARVRVCALQRNHGRVQESNLAVQTQHGKQHGGAAGHARGWWSEMIKTRGIDNRC
jgi:hypothetical protein